MSKLYHFRAHTKQLVKASHLRRPWEMAVPALPLHAVLHRQAGCVIAPAHNCMCSTSLVTGVACKVRACRQYAVRAWLCELPWLSAPSFDSLLLPCNCAKVKRYAEVS